MLNLLGRRKILEPLHPELRTALKKAHPGLTDKDIDRAEELLAQRMLYDPEKESLQIAQLDRERMELIERKMPRYAEITQAFGARMVKPRRRPDLKARVTIKKPKK